MRATADNLSARRGEEFIFRSVSFTLSAGDALVLTGRNGSGKSTLIRVLAGLLRPEGGDALFHDSDGAEPRPLGEASHYLGHRNGMKRELTVAENLKFWQVYLDQPAMRAVPALDIEAAADAVGLSAITHLPYGYLSAGQQRRFAMARLLVAPRPVWLLDEPTAALDAAAEGMFAGLMAAHRRTGGIVIAATHHPLGLEDAANLAMQGFDPTEAEAFA